MLTKPVTLIRAKPSVSFWQIDGPIDSRSDETPDLVSDETPDLIVTHEPCRLQRSDHIADIGSIAFEY